MSRIILHVGTHKTATTTIQRHLFANREELRARGIWYPGYDIIGKRNHYAHLGIVNGLAGTHDKFSKENAKKFFQTVARQAQDYDVTIISAEPFYRHVAYDEENKIPSDAEKYWRLRKRYVEEVRELFNSASVEVAMVFREQSTYAESLYQEHVKVTRYTRDFRCFLKEFWFHFEYLGQAQVWAHAFDHVNVATFPEIIAGGSPAMNFGSALGVDLSGGSEVPAANAGLHTDMVILKRMLQGSSLKRGDVREVIEAAAEGPLRARLSNIGKRSFFGSAEATRKFHSSFSASNESLRSTFRPDLPAPMFDAPSSEDVRFGDKLNPHVINEILKEVLNR